MVGIMANSSQHLGRKVQDFGPGISNIIAGFILSCLSLAAGVSGVFFPLREAYRAHWNLPFEAKTGWCWFAVGVLNLLGLLMLFVAWFLFTFSRHLMTRNLRIYEDGFQMEIDGKDLSVRWDQIALIVETTVYERPPILKGPARLLLPEIASKRYTLVRNSANEALVFDGNTVKDIAQFGEILRGVAGLRAIPLTTTEEHS